MFDHLKNDLYIHKHVFKLVVQLSCFQNVNKNQNNALVPTECKKEKQKIGGSKMVGKKMERGKVKGERSPLAF